MRRFPGRIPEAYRFPVWKRVVSLSGDKGQRHRLFRGANESLLHAIDYTTRDRRDRKGQFRRLDQRINAAVWLRGLSCSSFVPGLQRAGVIIDRKAMVVLVVGD